MLFNSLEFIPFLLTVLFVYHVLPLGWPVQKTFLLVASYLFYTAWNPPFGLLLLASTVADYWIAARMSRSENPRARKAWLVLSCTIGLGILAFFKYSKFFFANWMAIFPAPAQMPTFIENIVLPAGVSFYTFQSMSYTIDIYRRQIEPAKTFRDFALFVAFFPQLVAGPIVRAADFLPQLDSRRRVVPEHVTLGLDQIARGFAKKVIFADTLSIYVDAVFAAPQDYTSLNVLLAIYAYAFQIYYDFSGYSDIALGCARLMGFTLMRNFDLPYLAANPSDFWRRWHISLSTWLRDYLYISLGGSKFGTWKTYRNLFLTMLIGGLWHGAAWGFVLWGAYHGLLLIAHRYLFRDRALPSLPKILTVPVMFHLVCLGWIPFRARSLTDAQLIFKQLMEFDVAYAPIDLQVLIVLAISVPLHILGASAWLKRTWENGGILPRMTFYSAVILVILATARGAAPFIYFQF
jgi:alginate O-acetyltransferase complex protein AlgI